MFGQSAILAILNFQADLGRAARKYGIADEVNPIGSLLFDSCRDIHAAYRYIPEDAPARSKMEQGIGRIALICSDLKDFLYNGDYDVWKDGGLNKEDENVDFERMKIDQEREMSIKEDSKHVLTTMQNQLAKVALQFEVFHRAAK